MFEYEFCMRICWKCSKCTTPLRVSTRPTKSHLRRRKSRRWINRWWFRWSRAIYHSKLASLLRSWWCGCRSQLRSLSKSRQSCVSTEARSRWRTTAPCTATWKCRWGIATRECRLWDVPGIELALGTGKANKNCDVTVETHLTDCTSSQSFPTTGTRWEKSKVAWTRCWPWTWPSAARWRSQSIALRSSRRPKHTWPFVWVHPPTGTACLTCLQLINQRW